VPKCGHPPSVEAVNDIESFIGVGRVKAKPVFRQGGIEGCDQPSGTASNSSGNGLSYCLLFPATV